MIEKLTFKTERMVPVRLDEAALASAVRRLGWRVYATDQTELSSCR